MRSFITSIFALVIVGVQSFTLSSLKQDAGHQCGVEASANLVHHNPWLVYLEFFRHKHLADIRCGATLIDSKHVITAAHCVKKPKYSRLSVRLGEYDLSSKQDCVQGVCADPIVHIDVDEVLVHPDYDGKSHDIAILKLKNEAPYTDFIRPICLPSGNPEEGAILSSAGWGEIPMMGVYSNVKKIVPLPVWETSKCQKAYENTVLPTHIICAGGEEGIDTCRGDSGGPLTKILGKTELVGVTSGGNVHCGTSGSPGIYTSVMDHLEWIKTVINK